MEDYPWEEDWAQAFEQARQFMAERGYRPIDDPGQVADEKFLFLVNWHGKRMDNIDLEERILAFANLEGTGLVGTRIKGADLRKANLEGADLVGVNLEATDFTGTHLENAELRAVHLKGAVLIGAYLKGADLTEAHLEGAKLLYADFQGAKNLRMHQFGSGVGDEKAEDREWVYRELMLYWRRLGHHEDEDWARVRYHRARLEVMREDGGLRNKLFWVPAYKFLDLVSIYGTSVSRALLLALMTWCFSAVIYIILDAIYSAFGWGYFLHTAPHLKYVPVLSEFYFSAIAFVTIGFGDMGPTDWLGQVLVGIEVLLGYIMLGVMVSVIARKMSR